jgi:glycosyltransferase involved in cell wall biosynthesis
MSGEIIFVHSRLAMGGAERLRLSLLRELFRRGISCRICLLQEYGELVEPIHSVGFPVDVLSASTSLYSLSTQQKLREYFHKHRPRIVHAGQFITNVHVTAAVKASTQCPVVIEEHGHSNWKKWHHRLLDRMICRRADAVVCCSRSVARHVQGIIGTPDSQIFPIHNCVDPFPIEESDQATTGALKDELGIPSDAFVVGTVGKLRPEKGHCYLLEAWKQFRAAAVAPCKLVIVGDGPLRGSLREQARDIPDVVWAGQSTDVAKVLSIIDVFAFPSIDEGLGIALLEAMHAGKVVVASDTGGIPEVIDHERNGLLCSPGDSLQLSERLYELYTNPEKRKQFGAVGKSDVRTRNTPEYYCDRILEMHAMITGEPLAATTDLLDSMAA